MRQTYRLRDSGRSRPDWSWAIPLLMVAAMVVVIAWHNQRPSGSERSASSPTPTATPAAPTVSPSVKVDPPSQPLTTVQGYEYLLTRERWVVRQSTGAMEVQLRRRESWRAADGWAWARQTGDDPARYIFAPDTDAEPLTQVDPDVADLRRAVRTMLRGVPSAELDAAQFGFVADLVGVETLPVGALPLAYRKALVSLVASSDQVAVTKHAEDPLGRDATRISLTEGSYTQSVYLDRAYQYLADTSTDRATGEHGYRIAVERRHVSAIPASLLDALGSDRVEKGLLG